MLPMFGFPTRVRPLYSRKPNGLADDEDSKSADRPLDFAVSSFAPGAEVLRDKQIHTCIGFAAFEYKGKAFPRDPLGEPRHIHRCPACGAIEVGADEDEAPCSLCQTTTVAFPLTNPSGLSNRLPPARLRRPG